MLIGSGTSPSTRGSHPWPYVRGSPSLHPLWLRRRGHRDLPTVKFHSSGTPKAPSQVPVALSLFYKKHPAQHLAMRRCHNHYFWNKRVAVLRPPALSGRSQFAVRSTLILTVPVPPTGGKRERLNVESWKGWFRDLPRWNLVTRSKERGLHVQS